VPIHPTMLGVEGFGFSIWFWALFGLWLILTRFLSLLYGPPWAHCLGGYQDRLLGGPLGLPGLCHTTPDGVRRKDYGGEVLR
jgi:hypothetical protein